MELRINTESPAARAIIAMTHAAGTAEIYIKTLSRISNAVLFNQDDMGMDDTETIDTLRALSLLRNDIQDIATDKTIAGILEHADNYPDNAKNIAVIQYGTDGATGAPHIRSLSYLARSKAVHSFEYLEDIQNSMTREGYPAEKIAEIAEAIKMQKKAAEILDRTLAELTAIEAKEEGGDE